MSLKKEVPFKKIKKIGLFSNGNGSKYSWILRKQGIQIRSVRVVREDAIIRHCQKNGFDLVILTNDLVDRYCSREAIQKVICRIEEICQRIIVLSSWDDTLESENDLILVGSRESIPDKCKRILSIL